MRIWEDEGSLRRFIYLFKGATYYLSALLTNFLLILQLALADILSCKNLLLCCFYQFMHLDFFFASRCASRLCSCMKTLQVVGCEWECVSVKCLRLYQHHHRLFLNSRKAFLWLLSDKNKSGDAQSGNISFALSLFHWNFSCNLSSTTILYFFLAYMARFFQKTFFFRENEGKYLKKIVAIIMHTYSG